MSCVVKLQGAVGLHAKRLRGGTEFKRRSGYNMDLAVLLAEVHRYELWTLANSRFHYLELYN